MDTNKAIRRLEKWAYESPSQISHKAMAILSKLTKNKIEINRGTWIKIVKEVLQATNPAGTVASLATDKGNSYGEVTFFDDNNIVKLVYLERTLRLPWQLEDSDWDKVLKIIEKENNVPKLNTLYDLNKKLSPVPIILKKTLHLPLNRIFYGPPGTGKTYHTIKAAIEILAPEIFESSRDEQKAHFNTLVSEGKIRFVTFHQSFSYEDFVEGIRPTIVKDDTEQKNTLAYSVVSGVFKEICDAAQARTVTQSHDTIDITSRKIWKMSLGDSYRDTTIYTYCLENDKILMGWGGAINFGYKASKEHITNSLPQEWNTSTSVVDMLFHFINSMKIGDIVVIPEGLTKIRAVAEIVGEYEVINDESAINFEGAPYMQARKVRWLCQFPHPKPLSTICEKQFSQRTLYNFALTDAEREKLQSAINPQDERHPDKYVLIIDEINRGNISGIFGELITLIEPSKRLGAKEELKVILPYSRESFGVPDNLYIIGTMNTADRSLTGLDIALRRRFTFVEMPPEYELLENIRIENTDVYLSQILQAMNARIEVLLGRDYCLGHAPFMHLGNTVTVEELEPIFKNTIIPLLQEYFFEDWRKIHLVLNDHKKNESYRFITQKTIPADIFDEEELAKFPRELWEINEEAFEQIGSYVGITNPKRVIKNLATSTTQIVPELPSFALIDNFSNLISHYEDEKYYILKYKSTNNTKNYKIYVDRVEANRDNPNTTMTQKEAAKEVIATFNLPISLAYDSGEDKIPNRLLDEILSHLA